MAFATPKLDDRRFQDLVDEAKKRIPNYCREWTDHNVSDPGVTLIELFAWMTDILLYRINQLPHAHAIQLMELFGVSLQPPAPARTRITFWFSASQSSTVVIPAGTEVASTQTETERPIVFSTDTDLCVQPPQLAAVVSLLARREDRKENEVAYNLPSLASGLESREIFSHEPRADEALCFGFENDLSYHLLGFELDFDPAGGTGANPSQPPYVWEASSGPGRAHWLPCKVEIDRTRAMNTAECVLLHLPHMEKRTVGEKELYWVRARIKTISREEYQDGMRPYKLSPRLRRVSAASWGGAVPATHARTVIGEYVGQSDGSPGQRFRLRFAPVLARQQGEHLVVQEKDETAVEWQEVDDFSTSGPGDRHYTLDDLSGEVRFGPAIRQPEGDIRRYGAIPEPSAKLFFKRYRYGGGLEGNVQAGVLDTLKSAIPYIRRVSNLEAASGGLDAETLELAMMRLPARLRSRDRAVTEADFEFLTREALPNSIGRVKCIQSRHTETGHAAGGRVFVLVIPRLDRPEGFLNPDRLDLTQEEMKLLNAYLDERRLLTTRLEIQAPEYHWVSVKTKLKTIPGSDPEIVRAEVLARLYRFLNPLTGGQEGTGWPFGRNLYASEVYQCLQGLTNVQFIQAVELYSASPGGQANGQPREAIEIVAHGVIASGEHTVEFV